MTTAFGNGANDRASAMALQPDGKIVVAGVATMTAFQSDFAVARYNPDGSLYGTFGSGGKVTTNFPSRLRPSTVDSTVSVAIQSDGALVVGGHSNSSFGEFALVRYRPDGNLDLSFGSAGTVTTMFSQSGTASGDGA